MPRIYERRGGTFAPGEAAGFCAVFFALWLGYPNNFTDIPLLILLWPAGCAFLGKFAPNAKKALFQGWMAAFFGLTACLYWLYMPVHEVGGLHIVPAFACALLISFVCASQSGLLSLAAFFAKNAPVPASAVFLALSWYLLEYLYALIGGFPWVSPSAALAQWPLFLQIASIMGAYAADGLWLGAILLCAFSLPFSKHKFTLPPFLCGLTICALICGYGAWRFNLQEGEGTGGVNALFVEGNIDQNRKWEPSFQQETLLHYISLTQAGLEEDRGEGIVEPLVIWPETALPFFLQVKPDLSRVLRDFVEKERIPLLFGAPGMEYRAERDEPAVFNRAFLLAPSGKLLGSYDKEHLVPFGEYVPFWLKFGFLEALLQGVGVYEPGAGNEPLRYGMLALGMLICYEGIFPWLAHERVAKGANILVDLSNDGWFGRSAAMKQHLFLLVPRCVEQNRWLLRSTNTGISCIVDSRGRIVLRGPLLQAGSLSGHAGLEEKYTLYYYIGRWIPGIAFALWVIFAWRILKQRTKNIEECCT